MTKKISILKYGTGNLNSLIRAFKYINFEVELVQKTDEILNSNILILPGIGASKYVMDYLSASERSYAISRYISSGKKIIGICLGMQILLSKSEEFGTHKGLDIIPGEVININNLSKKITTPHMGWAKTNISNPNNFKTSLLDKKEKNFFYYAHSYFCKLDQKYIYASCDYYGNELPAIISNNNVWGTQFHPELSSTVGINFLKRLVTI